MGGYQWLINSRPTIEDCSASHLSQGHLVGNFSPKIDHCGGGHHTATSTGATKPQSDARGCSKVPCQALLGLGRCLEKVPGRSRESRVGKRRLFSKNIDHCGGGHHHHQYWCDETPIPCLLLFQSTVPSTFGAWKGFGEGTRKE